MDAGAISPADQESVGNVANSLTPESVGAVGLAICNPPKVAGPSKKTQPHAPLRIIDVRVRQPPSRRPRCRRPPGRVLPVPRCGLGVHDVVKGHFARWLQRPGQRDPGALVTSALRNHGRYVDTVRRRPSPTAWHPADRRNGPILVVVLGTLPAASRRELALQMAKQPMKPLLCLNAAALAYLASNASNWFTTTERILAPFAATNHYRPDANESVPARCSIGASRNSTTSPP